MPDDTTSASTPPASCPTDSPHPVALGSHVIVQRGDGQWHACEVIERRCDDTESTAWEYYVHYAGQDRRLDEWVVASRVQLDADDGLGSRKGANVTPDREFGHRRATRNMKRKIDEINHVQNSAAHDEALEKEHEESTKLKNVQRIEMGRCQRPPSAPAHASPPQAFFCVAPLSPQSLWAYVWQIRDRRLVFLALSGRVCSAAEAIHLRVHAQVHEEAEGECHRPGKAIRNLGVAAFRPWLPTGPDDSACAAVSAPGSPSFCPTAGL